MFFKTKLFKRLSEYAVLRLQQPPLVLKSIKETNTLKNRDVVLMVYRIFFFFIFLKFLFVLIRLKKNVNAMNVLLFLEDNFTE